MADKPDIYLIISDLLERAYEETMKDGSDCSDLIGAVILLREYEDKKEEQ